jgi:hypothetical protein
MAKRKTTAKPPKKNLSKPAKKSAAKGKPQLYTIEVSLLQGLMTEKFVKANPTITRVIQIRGDQTLEDLHHAIFKAYDRFDAHMYEFQFGKRTMEGPRYVLAMAMENDFGEKAAGVVEETTIDSLGLKKDRAFGYWFDFGDDWWHQLDVLAVEAEIPPGKYPKITGRVGKSPRQYLSEEDDE